MQEEIKTADRRIKELKAEQEKQSHDRMHALTKAADTANVKLAKCKAALESQQKESQVRQALLMVSATLCV